MGSTRAPMSSALVAELLGIEAGAERTFLDALIPALAKISPALVPQILSHPRAMEIAQGVAAYPGLLQDLARATEDGDRLAILDAIAEIAGRAYGTHEVVVRLEQLLAGDASDSVMTMCARALAACRHPGFLAEQRRLLASGDPLRQRIAAKLLGYARDREAVPLLLAALRAENLVAGEEIVWALGEIGELEAVAALQAFLVRSLLIEPIIVALGKIGAGISVARLTPFLLEGTARQRELAAEAVSSILSKRGGSLGDAALDSALSALLSKLIDGDGSALLHYHALTAYARLGGRLEPKRILRALGAELEKKQLNAVQSFLAARGRPAASPPKGPKSPKGKGR